ncbi:unnamed protein product [Rodentolepis nana]|uniref:DUF5740 domain-containing protein n=1 Tax=Rodentolepis nana TaxID=102285 RepID=A0A0R3T8N0_RODNA|nr:unnamed protein product [Rodentolepis nana]
MSSEPHASQENIENEDQLNEKTENSGGPEEINELKEDQENVEPNTDAEIPEALNELKEDQENVEPNTDPEIPEEINEIKENQDNDEINGESPGKEIPEDIGEHSGNDGNEENDDDEMPMTSSRHSGTKRSSDKSPTGVTQLEDLESHLKSAIDQLTNLPVVDFLQNISKQANIHAQSVQAAREIARDFVSKTTDLAESMKMILSYDQMMLDKLNHTTAHDFGVKPKTDEETRAVMIDRAQKILDLGQSEYEVSHHISVTANPLRDYRFNACDEVNAIDNKLQSIKDIKPGKKETPQVKEINEGEESRAEHSENENKEEPAGQQGPENEQENLVEFNDGN